ncbi:MAG: tape measure protein [Sphingobium sp.]
MKLSLILEAIDRASRPLDRVQRATGGLGRSADRSARDVRGLDRRMDGATRSAGRLERAARGIGSGLQLGARRGIGALVALDRRLQISQARMNKLAYSAGSLIGSTIRSGVMAGGAIAGAGLTAGLYKIVSAGLMFEKFRTQLTGLEGSVEAGNRAMEWVSDFAAKTPYELDQVMEAFITLKAYGIDPTNGTLRALGDTAAGMGKSLMQAVEMIADAQTGEFERIKEFGIKASVQGDKVTFRWQNNGKEMSKTVKQTSTDIREALLGIMDQRFVGGMERLAQTTAGKWSNLMDGLTRTANRVWEGGLGQEVGKQLDRFAAWADSLEQDGSLKKWAEDTGRGLGDLVAAIGDTDWRAIGGGIRDVGGAIMQLASALRALDRWRNAIGDFQRGAEYYTGGGLLGGIENGQLVAPRWLRNGPKPAPALPKRLPNAPLQRPSSPSPMRAPRNAPMLPGQAPVRWPATPKGKLEISVKTDRGTTARPTKVAATGMDLEVNTGRQMGGFA